SRDHRCNTLSPSVSDLETARNRIVGVEEDHDFFVAERFSVLDWSIVEAQSRAIALAKRLSQNPAIVVIAYIDVAVRDRGGDRFSDYLRSEEHTSELQSRFDLVCRLLLE